MGGGKGQGGGRGDHPSDPSALSGENKKIKGGIARIRALSSPDMAMGVHPGGLCRSVMGPSRGQDGGGSRHRCGARNTIFDLPDSAETHFWVGGSPTALQPVRTGTLCLSMCMRVCKRAPGLSTVTESRVPRGQEGKAVPAKSMPVSISTQTFSGRGRGVVHQPGQLPRFTASSNRVTYQHPEGAAFWFTSLSPNRLGAPDASNKFLEAPS